MVEKCKPSYKNLNTIKSYSEQKYATVQWCQQNCENDEWLRQQVEQLRYLSPPAVRKRFDISKYLDEKHSYSCRGTVAENESQVIFDDSVIDVRHFDFRDLDNQVDKDKTDAVGENYNIDAEVDASGIITYNEDGTVKTGQGQVQMLRYCLPKTVDIYEKDPVYKDFGTMYKKDKKTREIINSYWYIAWNKDKPYYIRPDWLKNWKDGGIQSVARAQTFKAEYTGQLTSIDVKLAWNGSKTSDCGSPLYVQIWNTYVEYVDQSTWDSKAGKMKYKYLEWDKLDEEKKTLYTELKRPRWDYKDEKVLHKSGKWKGKPVQVAIKKNGKTVYVDKVERKWYKKKEGKYVRKVRKVHKPGHNKIKNKDKKTYYTDRYHPLAETVYTKVGETYPNITFDMPCMVEKDKYYAIVMFSPLSEWKHCPRWGGWGRNCRHDKAYDYGNAFMSKNNGKTWIIYGKDGRDSITDENGNKKVLDYKKGKWTPQDFAFECHVETEKYKDPSKTTKNHYSDKEHYLYLKPIYSNPIKSVGLTSECFGTEASKYGYWITFEVSTDGEVWNEIKNQGTLSISPDENGNQPRVLVVRAKLSRDPADQYKQQTPYIENITVTLHTELPKEMYARTSYYKPKTSPMLGANLWGRVFAPFTCEETVTCEAEIIQGTESNRHLSIISVNSLDEMLYQMLHDDDEENDDVLDNFKEEKIDIVTIVNTTFGEDRAKALTSNPKALDILAKYNIYIKPYKSDDGLSLYLLSFSAGVKEKEMVLTRTKTTEKDTDGQEVEVSWGDYEVGGIQIDDNVAYPILSLEGITSDSETGATGDSFSEMIDYTFDYENNILYFSKNVIEKELVEETLELKYNKVFISGLTSDEVGSRIDLETGLREDGLILDYFKETVSITEAMVTSRRVGLRVEPTDPIRSVKIYKYDMEEGDEPRELYEDYDYTLDLGTNELEFLVNSDDKVSTVLDIGDTLEIVYTPFLTDDSLAVGYFAKRTNVDKQVHIKNMYYEYKV